MISIIGNESYSDETAAPKSADAKTQKRRDDMNDLKDLALLSFRDQTRLTPLDTLFGDPVPSKSDSKHVRLL